MDKPFEIFQRKRTGQTAQPNHPHPWQHGGLDTPVDTAHHVSATLIKLLLLKKLKIKIEKLKGMGQAHGLHVQRKIRLLTLNKTKVH